MFVRKQTRVTTSGFYHTESREVVTTLHEEHFSSLHVGWGLLFYTIKVLVLKPENTQNTSY